LNRRANRGRGPGPRVLLFSLSLALACSLRASAGAAEEPAACGRRPILLLHGHYYTKASLTVLRDRFVRDGWPADRVIVLDLPVTACTHAWALILSNAVEEAARRSGCEQVDVVGHSRGGLAARDYIRTLGGGRRVAHLVTLGTPHHGTWSSRGCPGCGCREMRPGSDYLERLNAGDETPGATEVTSICSRQDGVVPARSSWLRGARNIEVRGVTHTDLLRSRRVYEEIRAGLL
jgi:triacylglycerol lipase